jgi:hypothetical protein
LVWAGAALAPLATAQVPDLYDPDTYREIRLTFSQTNWWQQLVQNYTPEINIPARMVVDNKTYTDVGVRFRGNTSYFQLPAGSEKKCFNIETDAFVPGQDIYGYNHLNLNNGFHDPTFMREFIGYWITRRHGLAPKANFVKLFLNDVYWGVYINVQQPNKDMMKEWFRSNDGNRYRGFPTSGTFGNGRCALTWLGTNVATYLSAYQAKQGDGTDLMQLCNVLNNTPAAQLPAALPAIFSVDQFYRYASCMNVMTNTDSYIGTGKDHYLYHDEIYGDFHMFPFDLNETLIGTASLAPTYNTTTSIKPAFSKTLPVPEWNARYFAHYRTVFEDTVNWQYLGPIITKYHGMIAADVAADTKKIYTTAQFTANLTQSVSTAQGTVPGLRTLIEARFNHLRGLAQFNVPRPDLSGLAHAPASPTQVDTVTITVQASSNAATVRLWSRSAGPFVAAPMFDDGQHGDGGAGDGIWGALLPPAPPGTLMDYYVEAATAGGAVSFWPKNAELFAPSYRVSWPTGVSPIRINEFVAQNVTGIVDENNQHEDWLELYNTSNLPVTVGGMYLTDNLLLATKWRIPASTQIAGHGTLLVWCDEDGTQGPMHASFKLSASGETIGLFATDGATLLDSYVFGPQQADLATGRVLDGSEPWATLLEPTPRLRNELAATGTRRYTARYAPDHALELGLSGAPRIGTTPALTGAGGGAATPAVLFVAPRPAYFGLAGIGLGPVALLVDPLSVSVLATTVHDGQGRFTLALPIPDDRGLVGGRVYLQTLAVGAGGVAASNALELVLGS